MITRRYRRRGLNHDDLQQAAYLGLVKAVQGFDPAFERDFLSYAVPTISGAVKRYFRDFGWTVRPPRRIQELQAEVSRASDDLSSTLGRSPRPSEVAQYLDTDLDSVIEALSADGCFTPASLDQPLGDDEGDPLSALLGGEDDELERAETRVRLAPAMRSLGVRDRRIVELRFFHGWTQQMIAEDIGVTQMQVSRLLARILTELRTQVL